MAKRAATKSAASDVFADNLAAVIKASGKSINRFCLEHQLEQPAIQRIVKQRVGLTVATAQRISDAIGLMPWQMFVPDMDPKNPPVIMPTSGPEKQLYEGVARLVASVRPK